jgi:hypothetical protein
MESVGASETSVTSTRLHCIIFQKKITFIPQLICPIYFLGYFADINSARFGAGNTQDINIIS